MDRSAIIDFFNMRAPTWDAEQIRNETVIEKILDCGGITAGKRVLDVACGTGILFEDYRKRKVQRVIAIDISPEMVKLAQQKCRDSQIEVLCGDVQNVELEQCVDCVIIYNAFPHFPEPEKVMEHLSKLLVPGGRLTIAHGMSRAVVDACHHGRAKHVSMGLMHENELADRMGQWFTVDTVISDAEKYIVSGIVKINESEICNAGYQYGSDTASD